MAKHKFCPYCGSPISSDVKFCTHCGVLLPQENQVKPRRGEIPQEKQLKPKKGGIPLAVKILVLLLLMALAGVGGFLLYGQRREARVQEYLELGDRYLSEIDYEQAVAAFEEVIELDPRRIEAYEGLASAYEGQGDYEAAAETLERGIETAEMDDAAKHEQEQRLISYYEILAEEAVSDGDQEAAQRNYERVLELDPRQEETSSWRGEFERKQEFGECLEELSRLLGGLAESENYEDFSALLGAARFREIMDLMNRLEVEDSMIFHTAQGDFGVYRAESRYGTYMLYYGGYNGQDREGTGIWIGGANDFYYCAAGAWSADRPIGRQTVREQYITSPEPDKEERVGHREIIGNTVNGLWDGAVDWGFIRDYGKDGYIVNFTEGHWELLYEEESHWIVSEEGYGEESSRMWISQTEEDDVRGILGFAQDEGRF